jgi:hypothetical protein
VSVPIDFCEPWTTVDKLCCPDAEPVDCVTGEPVVATYAWTDDELIEAATGILFRQTCSLFPGHCILTVRPCPTCDCPRRHCGCGRYPFISLNDRYPVISVDAVNVDGVTLDPGDYRVDDFHRLVRLDGECWPRCNDLLLPDDQPRTFSVIYTAGRRPPVQLQMAAAELACELKRACNGLDCRLPQNVTRVSRQGVSMDISALETAVNGGVSGLAAVDMAVRQYNCNRAKGRVWHPGLSKPRQVFPT